MANVFDDIKSGMTKFDAFDSQVQNFTQDLRGDRAAGAAAPRAAAALGRDVSKQRDPYVHLRFAVQIDHVEVALFSECSALTIENEVFEYQEGGLNSYVHKLPTRTKYGNVTLKRGLDDAQQLHQWFMQISSGRVKRQNVSIILYNATGKEVRRWDLQNAYPCKWTGPDLRADAGAVAVETVELAHEGLIPRADSSASAASAAAQAGGIFGRVRGITETALGDTKTALGELDKFSRYVPFGEDAANAIKPVLGQMSEFGKSAMDDVKEAVQPVEDEVDRVTQAAHDFANQGKNAAASIQNIGKDF